MPPPRNTGIPGSSIAGGLRQDELSQKQPRRAADNVQEQRSQNQSGVSVTEGEAQKSQPVHQTSTASVATPQPSPSSKPRKSKLRPRKAAMNLSPKAVEKLKEMMDQPEPKLIRVGVKNRGCSGLAYHLEYVDKPGMFDEAVEQDGVKVLIDSKALFSIIGSEMDWIEDKLNQRFIFKNPNITEQCGCGESFSIS
ncbi:Iron-sulfur assembly protein 1 [Zalaria obscura]|uniref:Iron-sulfur assembly protein 1 n=1 Tax=Zalaria obscura TaxID=2024903 RepID=A0ACC3S6V2_9PEZI